MAPVLDPPPSSVSAEPADDSAAETGIESGPNCGRMSRTSQPLAPPRAARDDEITHLSRGRSEASLLGVDEGRVLAVGQQIAIERDVVAAGQLRDWELQADRLVDDLEGGCKKRTRSGDGARRASVSEEGARRHPAEAACTTRPRPGQCRQGRRRTRCCCRRRIRTRPRAEPGRRRAGQRPGPGSARASR